MQLFCLQLEASCLQLSFIAYCCVWEFFAYNLFFTYICAYSRASLLRVGKRVQETPQQTVSKEAQL